MASTERIDKFLWCIRLFKTRTEATDACKGNKVKVEGAAVKPSREIRRGETLEIRKGAVQFKYKVVDFPPARVGAKLVSDYVENLTPQSELDKLNAPVETFFVRRDRGAGRPTKKDRRELDVVWDNLDSVSGGLPDDGDDGFGLSDDEES